MHIISWEFCPGDPPDGIVYHSVSRGQPGSFFNLDLPIKYAPDPELHGLKWRHKLPTNHAPTEPSQGREVQQCQTRTQQVQHGLNMDLHLFIYCIFKSKNIQNTLQKQLCHIKCLDVPTKFSRHCPELRLSHMTEYSRRLCVSEALTLTGTFPEDSFWRPGRSCRRKDVAIIQLRRSVYLFTVINTPTHSTW